MIADQRREQRLFLARKAGQVRVLQQVRTVLLVLRVGDVETDLVQPRGRSLEAVFPKGWLEAHPLTAADLEQEVEYLRVAGFRLRVG